MMRLPQPPAPDDFLSTEWLSGLTVCSGTGSGSSGD